MIAKEQNTTADNLRAQWGTQAALGIPQLLGGTDKAKALANAVASFIAKPFRPEALGRRVRELLDSPEQTRPPARR